MKPLSNEARLPVRKLPAMRAPELVDGLGLPPAVEPPLSRDQIRRQLTEAFGDELAELREAVRCQGYQEGHDAAVSEVETSLHAAEQRLKAEYAARLEALDESSTQLHAAIEGLEEAHRAALADLEPLAVEIAFSALTRLIGKAEHYRTVLTELVTQAVEDVSRQGEGLRVSMTPQDAALLSEWLQATPWAGRIVADAGLAPGSCVVEAGPRCLDASLMRQVESLRQCLLRVCAERRHD